MSPVKTKHQQPLAETPARPPVTPLLPTSASSGSNAANNRNVPRDRRAFSFPATQSPPPPISIAQRRNSKQSQAMALPFVRKTMGVSLTSTPAMNTPVKEGPTGTLRAPSGRTAMLRASKSTGGANTPLDTEAVFCSTSESEGEGEGLAIQPTFSSVPVTATTSTVPSSVPLSRRSTKSRSSRPIPSSQTSPSLLFRPDYMIRKPSQSPVAQLVASSGSSRSREDIISWAKAVGWRPSTGDTSEDGDEEERGRTRTRRADGKPSAPLPGDDVVLDDHAGTTPKGGNGSALAGLSIGGIRVGPIVQALTSTISPHPPQFPKDTSGLGLQAGVASAQVSTVEVVTSAGGIPIASPIANDWDVPYHYGGATPTLSTISFSEAIEPSVNGTFDHAEIATDDAQSNASYARRPVPPKLLKQPAAKQALLPLRPITTTATAIWNLSTYIRSFSPFSISSVIAPYAPFSANGDSKHPSGVVTPAPIPEETEEETQASSPSNPLPAFRAEQEEPELAPREMVRSLPMDIVVPLNEQAIQAQKDKIIQKQGRSSSRHRSRSRSRSRGRHASRPGLGRSRSRSASSPPRQGRRLSYDADGSDEEEEEVDERRGRSRRGRGMARDEPKRRESEVQPSRPEGVRRLSEGGMRMLGERSGSRGDQRRR